MIMARRTKTRASLLFLLVHGIVGEKCRKGRPQHRLDRAGKELNRGRTRVDLE